MDIPLVAAAADAANAMAAVSSAYYAVAAVGMVVSGLIGGFVGAYTAGVRQGEKMQQLADGLESARQQLARHESRLSSGDKKFDTHLERLAVLSTKMEASAVSMSALSRSLTDTFAKLVTPEKLDGAIAQHRIDCPAATPRPPRKTR